MTIQKEEKAGSNQHQNDAHKYQFLFHNSPAPLWEEDFSRLQKYLTELKKSGISDIREYLVKNPEELAKCAALIEIIDVNQATLELHEAASKEELLGNLDKIFTPRSYEVFLDEVVAVARGAKFFETEGEVRTLKNNLRFVHLTMKIDYEYNNSSRALISTIDITRRKAAENALKESEARFRSLVEYAHVIPWRMRWSDEHFTYVGDQIQQILGYPNYFWRTLADWASKIHPEDREMATGFCRKATVRGEDYQVEYRYLAADGEVKWLRDFVTVRKNSEGEPFELIGYMFDITRHKQSELALAESQRMITTLMSNLPGMAYRCKNDSFWTMEFVSYGARDLTGYSGEELINNHKVAFADLIIPDDREPIWNKVQEAVGRKESYQLEYRIRCKVGEVKWVWEQGQGVFNDRGELVSLEGFITDITENKLAQHKVERYQKELEKLVQERTRELEEVNREMESFAYTVSHDLRAPLRAIHGYSSWLAEDFGQILTGDAKRYVNAIQNAVNKMGRLIDALLMLSRVTRQGIQIQEVNLSQMVRALLNRLLEIEPERNVEVKIYPDCYVRGDIHLLEIAINNLLENALKFTSIREKSRIEFGCREQSDERVFFIKDNGIGFNPKYKDQLFQPFKRLHREEDFPGTGIGLATVKRIIERHGGNVWVESEPEEGTTIWFTLPDIKQS
ncbi:MAG: hypothetical protein Kow0037_32020 [Calditrichia bacterium]